MTRLWQPALPLRVLVVDGAPVAFHWAGQRWRVDQTVGRWRVRVWWRGIWREYYKLTAVRPRFLLLVVYLDLHEGIWYLQEVFD